MAQRSGRLGTPTDFQSSSETLPLFNPPFTDCAVSLLTLRDEMGEVEEGEEEEEEEFGKRDGEVVNWKEEEEEEEEEKEEKEQKEEEEGEEEAGRGIGEGLKVGGGGGRGGKEDFTPQLPG